ncbi:protein MAIN-LIKE 1 isoform X3 [Coffea arabica]|uniref:Protein MAIN-LIKE 1 isoform X3 n=1 Tax=Coffea arabica TaxID=13443 RepID=A0A6P6SRS8_COFAR
MIMSTSIVSENKRSRGRRGRQGNRKRSCGDESTSGQDLGSEKANGEVSGLKKRKPSKKVTEDVIPPEQRGIPDTPLLHNLGKHPSIYARLGRGTLTQNLNFRGAWPTALGLYRQAHDQYKELFGAAGFGDFLKIDPVHIPQAYLVALMERWFSETNTIHLPCCEIGPTPVDWAMVTGLQFKGESIRFNHQFEMSKALELLGVESAAVTEGKIRLSSITPTIEELVKYLEHIDEVGNYNWAAITFAAFLAGMRRKVTGETGAFTGFWPFLLFWAFEYLDIFRPNIVEADVFPRAIRWSCPNILSSADFSDLFAARCQLDYIEEAQVTWQPYLASSEFGSTDMVQAMSLAQKRAPFESIDTWEYYLGERCRRQLGFPCRVPLPPPDRMHGTNDLTPEDEIGVGKPADNLVMDENVDYSSWFAVHSVGKIVDLSRFLGGVETGAKVLSHWVAAHHPDILLVRRSDYESMAEAYDAAVAECQMLRAKLAQAE